MSQFPISLSYCDEHISGARVLITGGAGFIGSHLTEFLCQHGAEQVILVDNRTRARSRWLADHRHHPQVTYVEADILDAHVLASWLQGVDVVFHLAAIATVMNAVRDPERTFAVNTMGTVQVASAAQRARVRRFVFTSSREVYGDPLQLPVAETAALNPKNIYGASKVAAELFLQTIDPVSLEVVVLRLANVYGPGDSERVVPIFLHNALQRMPLLLYGGDQLLDLIWIGDVVEALVKAGFSERPVREPTNIGSGVGTSLRTLAQRIIELTGCEVPIQILPERGPEVNSFQADLTEAGRWYGILSKADALDRLPDMVTLAQSELSEIG